MDEHDLLRAISITDGFQGSWWATGGRSTSPVPLRSGTTAMLISWSGTTRQTCSGDHLRAHEPVIEHPHSRVRRDWHRGDVLAAGPDTIVLDGFPGLQILVGRF